jgi:hypothetical protein
MGIVPEKNDVDISKLFNWGGQFSILDKSHNEIFSYYSRVIGDADLNKSRVYALRESAKLREKLRDTSSEEFSAYHIDESLLSKEQLVEYTLYFATQTLAKDLNKKSNIRFPKEPDSDASLEEQEKYQKEIDGYPKLVSKSIAKELDKQVTKERKTIEARTKESLYSDYIISITNELCEKEMMSKFSDACIFYSSYKDQNYKIHLFDSIEQFQDTPSYLKQQFESNYSSLEIDMDSLKKLPEVTL